MATTLSRGLKLSSRNVARVHHISWTQGLASHAKAKKEGDISSVFVSLSGGAAPKLPERFADVKRQLIRGNEERLIASWKRLLQQLAVENETTALKGPSIVPQIDFADLKQPSDHFLKEVKKRGVAVIRGVVPEDEARSYKNEVEDYVRANPWTKAFPAHDPQVFELYWSPPQIKARSHPNMLETQRFLMKMWHSSDPNSLLSTSQPLAYADRVRIRQPGDAGFALGPHVDAGSVERWEQDGYGKGGVYDKIFGGEWEEFDSWESSVRVPAVSDLYEGAGACSMFRMFQGWLSMSTTAPNEGTLMVNPLLQLSTAYFLLRPFFNPINPPEELISGEYSQQFLDARNWELKTDTITSELQGANPGHSQELNQILHPHLDLKRTMVHVPNIKPGDYVAWHCDTIHAVDKVHQGKSDSSVMYIPVCPVTEANAEYLARQRETCFAGFPGPDFPGGKGESEHTGRPTELYLRKYLSRGALQGLGMEKLPETLVKNETQGAKEVMRRANEILGFA